MARPHVTLAQVQSAVSYALGVFIALYETVVENADRPELLVLAAGCLGLPTFLKRDAAKKDASDQPPNPAPDPPPDPPPK